MSKISDLSPEEPGRRVYASMCQLVLRHTDYTEHLHRFKVTRQNDSNEVQGPAAPCEHDWVWLSFAIVVWAQTANTIYTNNPTQPSSQGAAWPCLTYEMIDSRTSRDASSEYWVKRPKRTIRGPSMTSSTRSQPSRHWDEDLLLCRPPIFHEKLVEFFALVSQKFE